MIFRPEGKVCREKVGLVKVLPEEVCRGKVCSEPVGPALFQERSLGPLQAKLVLPV